MAALDLPTKIIWANIQYLSIMFAPVSYFFLSIQFTSRYNVLQMRRLRAVLIIIPVMFNIFLWTNDFHGLIRQNIFLDSSGSFPIVGKTFGPLFWVFAVYNFTLTISNLVILAEALREKISLYHNQLVCVFWGLLLPVVANALYLSGVLQIKISPVPTVMGLSGLIIALGIFRYRLFDIVPFTYSLVIQEMRTGIIAFNNEGRLLEINPAAGNMLGLTSKQQFGLHIEKVLSAYPILIDIYREGKEADREIVIQNKEIYDYYEVSLTRLQESSQRNLGWLMQLYNITERKRSEEAIRHAAGHDALTGLPNGNYFKALFKQELAHAILRQEVLTVAYLDLDDFKLINDTYGHDIGDEVLCEFAKRLKGALRESDVIARLGGDEFVILLPAIKRDEKIDVIARKIFMAFEESFYCQGLSLQIRASIGFSAFPRDGDNMEVLLKKADKAMYRVKEDSKNNYWVYKEV